MSRSLVARLFTLGVVALAVLSPGCGGKSPSGPTPTPPPPIAIPPPTISAISPNAGSTGGGTPLKVTGSGFRSGATATVDGEPRPLTVESTTTVRLTTPARGTGAVDVVVTNADGQTHRHSGGYTYVSPQSFDFNGTWVGSALAHPELGMAAVPNHSDMDMRFTIRDNQLTSLTCGGTATTFTRLPSVAGGEFSFVGEAGATIAGRIVSNTDAIGTINTDDCPATRWTVARQ